MGVDEERVGPGGADRSHWGLGFILFYFFWRVRWEAPGGVWAVEWPGLTFRTFLCKEHLSFLLICFIKSLILGANAEQWLETEKGRGKGKMWCWRREVSSHGIHSRIRFCRSWAHMVCVCPYCGSEQWWEDRLAVTHGTGKLDCRGPCNGAHTAAQACNSMEVGLLCYPKYQ